MCRGELVSGLVNNLHPALHVKPKLDRIMDRTNVRNRLAEIEKTLAAVASQLSASEAVKLSDGSSVKRSDLDAHSMMTRTGQSVDTMAQSSAELAEAVKKRGRVTIDVDKVNAHFAGQLDSRLQRALEPSVARLEQALDGFGLG